MSEERRHPGCPVKYNGPLVPPRYQQGPITTALNLGPLGSLAGCWRGSGFNAIWRPDNPESQPGSATRRFLELNLTSETIDFHVIPGVVPNRGLNPQTDLSLYGLHYLQRVTDADPPQFSTSGQALHIEPGLFMNVPSSDESSESTIARLASIPHGVSILMQGRNPGNTPHPGPPVIPPVYPIHGLPPIVPASALALGIQPIDVTIPLPPSGFSTPHTAATEGDLATDGPGSQSNVPPGGYPPEFQGYVNDPNSLLREAIAGQDILGHITINLSTDCPGGKIGNIPFLGLTDPADDASSAAAKANIANAFVSQVNATFWIEWVRIRDFPRIPKPEEICRPIYEIEPYWPEPTYLQLQYSQVAILIFNGVFWPHVTVATLTLSAG